MVSLVQVLSQARREQPTWLLALGLTLLLYVPVSIAYLYPTTLFFHGDDFGYTENLLQTYWRGSYTPSDWLAPVNWTLSTLGAFVLKMTGSVALSSLGLNFVFFLLTLVALERVFAAVGLPPLSRAFGIVLLYANPTLFGKTLEYTGVTLSFLLVVLSLLGALRNAPLAVLVCGLGAAFTRQSGVGVFALLVAPVVVALTRGRKPSARELRWLGLGLLGALTAAVGLSLLPRGWTGQHYASPHEMLKHLSPVTALKQFPVLIVCWGNATFFGQRLLRRPLRRVLTRRNLAIGFPLAAGLGALGALHVVELAPTFNMHWPGHFSLLWKLSTAALLLVDYSALAWTPTLVAGLGASLLMLARGIIWDFYLLDTFLLFLVAASQTKGPQPSKFGTSGWGLLLVSAILLGINTYAGLNRLRRAEASALLLEHAQRSGSVPVLECNMSDAFTGWKVFNHYVREQNAFTDRRDLMGMKKYLDGAKYYVLPEDQFRAAQIAGQVEATIASRVAGPVGLQARFYLARLSLPRHEPMPLAFANGTPEFRPLPTSNTEWDKLAAQGDFFPQLKKVHR